MTVTTNGDNALPLSKEETRKGTEVSSRRHLSPVRPGLLRRHDGLFPLSWLLGLSERKAEKHEQVLGAAQDWLCAGGRVESLNSEGVTDFVGTPESSASGPQDIGGSCRLFHSGAWSWD